MDFWGRKPENDFIRAFEEMTEGHENNHKSQLSTERMEELEIQIQQDEKPIKLEPDESGLSEPEREKKKLKWELRKEALTRMEEAARTEADFEKVTGHGTNWMPTENAKSATMKSSAAAMIFPWSMVGQNTVWLFRSGSTIPIILRSSMEEIWM